MKSRLILSLATLVLVFSIPLTATAATFAVTKIGSLDLGGKTYSEWWYTAINPTLYGTAPEGSTITVNADGIQYNTEAASDGSWSVPLSLASGDHSMTVTDGTNSYSFTLHLGQDVPTSTDESTTSTTVPQTGMNQTAALFLGIGVSLLALYFYFFESTKKRRIFERDIVSK
jgi:hypothetical protein